MAMTDAWQVATDEPGSQVIAPFKLDDDSGPFACSALVVGFGGPSGTVALPLDSPDRERLPGVAQRAGYSYSLLANPYDRCDRDHYITTRSN
jgi:hypothetical protein